MCLAPAAILYRRARGILKSVPVVNLIALVHGLLGFFWLHRVLLLSHFSRLGGLLGDAPLRIVISAKWAHLYKGATIAQATRLRKTPIPAPHCSVQPVVVVLALSIIFPSLLCFCLLSSYSACCCCHCAVAVWELCSSALWLLACVPAAYMYLLNWVCYSPQP